MHELNAIDLAAFCAYFVVLVTIGFLAGARQKKTSEAYFLAGRQLPWYVVGASFIGSNISTEHFIGMVGSVYVYGMCVATWEWGNIWTFSVLIWVFIPFLLASRVFTAPEFLERRYNSACRLFFAVLTVIANVTAFLAAVLYAAAVGLIAMFKLPETVSVWRGFEVPTLVLCVVGMGVVAGSYAIYGGLRSVAWTDVFQVVVMVAGGALVTAFGLLYLGEGSGLVAGWRTMVARNLGQGSPWADVIARAAPKLLGEGHTVYNRLAVFHPLSHKLVPWPTILVGWVSVGVWYNCANQFMIQRVLAAKDQWHARMGIVLAGFIKIFMPVLVVVPGLIYFAIEPGVADGEADQTYPRMVMLLLHVGVRGVLLAALFGAIQSTIDSVLNSTSTIISLDIYRKFIRPDVSEESLVRLGKWLGAAVLVVSMALAPFIGWLGKGVFVYIQNLFAYFAPPMAAVFLAGILWKRANAVAATVTIPAGIACGLLLEFVGSKVWAGWFGTPMPFTVRSILNWLFCLALMVVVSLATAPPAAEKIGDDLTINWRKLTTFRNLGTPWYRNLGLWYLVFAAGIIACYLVFSGLFVR